MSKDFLRNDTILITIGLGIGFIWYFILNEIFCFLFGVTGSFFFFFWPAIIGVLLLLIGLILEKKNRF